MTQCGPRVKAVPKMTDIIFLYHGNLFFDEVEEVDGVSQKRKMSGFRLKRIMNMRKKIWYWREREWKGRKLNKILTLKEFNKKKKKQRKLQLKRKKQKVKMKKLKKTDKPEGVEKKDHGGARPKTVQTVPVPFNTRTRSARKKEKDEIEKEVEKNIQRGIVGEGPPVTGPPATGMPVTDKPGTGPPATGMPLTDTPATGPPVKPTPNLNPKGVHR